MNPVSKRQAVVLRRAQFPMGTRSTNVEDAFSRIGVGDFAATLRIVHYTTQAIELPTQLGNLAQPIRVRR
jgi:hypothetical protein